MKKILFCLCAIAFSVSLMAVTATPEPFEVTQPDGSTITVRLIGDEYYAYYTTLDGTPLRRLDNGFFVEDYSVKENFADIASQRRAQAIRPRSEASSYPLTGSPKALVLLVGFQDLPFEQPLEAFNDLLNQSGYDYNGSTGSCRDYFIAASDSLFQPQFDVYGPFTVEGNMADYGAESGSTHDSNPYNMVIEACAAAAESGVDFDLYDTNNDGVLDNVFIYYAGYSQAEGGPANSIWPHKSSVAWTNTKVDGKYLATYACSSEYAGNSGKNRANIGSFCHEFGHVLGLPDLYDTGYKHYTVSNWDIMCSGNYNNNNRTPPTYSAYERFFLGWGTPQQLVDKGEYSLEPLLDSKQSYLIAVGEHNLVGDNPNPKEFFLLEYRKKEGWDKYLPGEGMLVWHIDYLASAWRNNTPNNGPDMLRIHLEEANGILWNQRGSNEAGKASDPYPGTQNITEFIPKLHDGTILANQNIFNITQHDTRITFIYRGVGDVSLSTDVSEISLTTTISDSRKIVDWEPQPFHITANELNDSIIEVAVNKNYFFLAASEEAPKRSSNLWARELQIVTHDSTFNQTIWVSYVPGKQSCDETIATVNVSTLGASTTIGLKAYSPRPTYITTPVLKPTTNITPYSFRIAWEPVEDAVLYYLNLFQSQEGEQSYIQGFENFNNFEAIKEEGWSSTTNNITTSAKSEGTKSLYFKKTGDQITSELYQAPISSISFWINAFASSVSEVGYIDLEAWNGTEWVTSEEWRTTILSTTKRKTFTFAFTQEDNFTQFRLTYTDNGGSGAAIDAFTATCTRNITYIYKGKELSVEAINDEAYCFYEFNNLTENSTYYFTIQSSDITKGCEEHISEATEVTQVTTTQVSTGNDKDENQLPLAVDSINFDAPTQVVYISNPQTGSTLYIYNAQGKLVYSCPTYTGITQYVIPTEQLQKGALYVIKYAENGTIRRKQGWAKFML
ncbi:MAG: M6 family metalloprotease domain-containing protein [Paludibacteraceae bacterium]|nr:M6 family metalloprotease domain-containing protein [Paludibacteraceae bacterium]